jgi:2',3'-cyclic-nucleotide 2'-phosphodiesterase (5'-nucleotidase family)
MRIGRRDLLKLSGAAALSGTIPRITRAADAPGIYELERFGNARILHTTDTHAQLLPVYFREPSVNLGIGEMQGKPPHLVGRAFIDRFGIRADSADAYAFTCLDFEKSAARFGKLGGFAHLKTLIDRLRGDVGPGRSLLLDGGDLWQGTGLANAMQGADMVEVANLLGIEAMTGHWEFTYGEKTLRDNLSQFKGEFLAQNVFLTEEAAFNDAPAFDAASGRVFKPATIKELGGSHTPNASRRTGPSAFATMSCRNWSMRCETTTRSMRSCCCRITEWTSISSWQAALPASTSFLADTPTTRCRSRFPSPMPAVRRWSPTQARTENSSACSISNSPRAR